NPSYVLRPRRSASDSKVSSTLNLLPSSPRSISNDQPAYSNSSPPPGASTTPSSDTNSVEMILPMEPLRQIVGDLLMEATSGGSPDRQGRVRARLSLADVVLQVICDTALPCSWRGLS